MKWIPERKALVLACAVGTLAAFAAFPPSAMAADRVVICEEFTATW